MDRDGVEVVRRFNRVVTQRVGALDEEYLARGRPLGASRLLWEVGAEDGRDDGGGRTLLRSGRCATASTWTRAT